MHLAQLCTHYSQPIARPHVLVCWPLRLQRRPQLLATPRRQWPPALRRQPRERRHPASQRHRRAAWEPTWPPTCASGSTSTKAVAWPTLLAATALRGLDTARYLRLATGRHRRNSRAGTQHPQWACHSPAQRPLLLQSRALHPALALSSALRRPAPRLPGLRIAGRRAPARQLLGLSLLLRAPLSRHPPAPLGSILWIHA